MIDLFKKRHTLLYEYRKVAPLHAFDEIQQNQWNFYWIYYERAGADPVTLQDNVPCNFRIALVATRVTSVLGLFCLISQVPEVARAAAGKAAF